jgi:dolichol kinase
MPLSAELKRKLFHHLSLLYMGLYGFAPAWISTLALGLSLLVVSVVEFIRLRRPEVNAQCLKVFGGLYRPAEILTPSGICWTLAGFWLTMVLLVEKTLVLPAMGMLVFGDTAAALVGQRWGTHYWPSPPVEPDTSRLAWMKIWKIPANSSKTLEGSAAFAAASFLWIALFLRPHVALLGAAAVSWVESRRLEWNDNFLIPVCGGMILGVLSLLLAGGVGRTLHRWQEAGIVIYVITAFASYAWYSRQRAVE